MDINIKVKPDLDSEYMERTIDEGTSLEELLKDYKDSLKYTVVAAIVDNRLQELDFIINHPCSIEFIDMRTSAGKMVYQRSLCFVYLKAISDVLGNVKTNIFYSISKGLYTEIDTEGPIHSNTIKQIEKRMREIVDEDFAITRTVVSKKEAIEYLDAQGSTEKSGLLGYANDVHYIAFYELDGYKNYFYGKMVPSTKYVNLFELRKYRDGIILRYPHTTNPGVIPPYENDNKLYESFNESKTLGRMFGISYVKDLNRAIENGHSKRLIQFAEEWHTGRIKKIARMIIDVDKRIVLVAGPSSSGKTTFAKRLCEELAKYERPPLYLGTDDYFVDRKYTPLDKNGEPNFEDLDAIDVDLFSSNMNDLLEGKSVDLPTYNFIKGEKEYGKRITKISHDQPIVIEGIHALNGQMSVGIDDNEKFKVYISPLTQLNIDDHNRIPVTDVRLLRRMVRDHWTRGNSVKETIDAWPKVRAGEDKNIFPYNGEADVLFNSTHLYELCVLKKHVEPLLAEVGPDMPEYVDAERILDFLGFFLPIDDESTIPSNSLLREFIGGSSVV